MRKMTRRGKRRNLGQQFASFFRPLRVETLEERSFLATLTPTGTTSDVVFNLPATVDTVYLEDDGTAGNGISRLRSSNGTFASTTFTNPTGSLTINRGNPADTITVNALPDFTAG